MNVYVSLNSTNSLNDTTNHLCTILDEIGWIYERKNNCIQISFKTSPETRVSTTVSVVEVLKDKLFFSTSVGIKVPENKKADVLNFLNYLNTTKIYYGRFIMTETNEIWYDFTVNLNFFDLEKNFIKFCLTVASGCPNKFANTILDVATGAKSVEDAITVLKD